jgi:arylsulfatase
MPRKQPNVLILFTDQQRADSIGVYGNRFARTPHMDRLAAEGARFTSAYTPCPVCVPARGCLHYGQYPQTTDSFENSQSMPTDDRPSFMDVFSQAVYRTHGVGKVHFQPDPQALRGFQTRQRQEEIVPDPRAMITSSTSSTRATPT